MFRTISVAALLSFVIGLALPAQTPSPGSATTATAQIPRYEVVSIKPGNVGCGMSVSAFPNRFVAKCITVWGLMFNAYSVSPNDRPAGLPGWADSATFDVDAKMDDGVAAALQKLSKEEQDRERDLMLQALLADYFKLRVHNETQERPIYALVIAKGGSKLKPWPADKTPRGTSWGGSLIRVQGGPIERLTFCLSDTLHRNVIDRTGLTGNYDIDLKWTPDDQLGRPDAGPTMFTALEEQLGLKLESTKGPTEVFVVDRVERPQVN